MITNSMDYSFRGSVCEHDYFHGVYPATASDLSWIRANFFNSTWQIEIGSIHGKHYVDMTHKGKT